MQRLSQILPKTRFAPASKSLPPLHNHRVSPVLSVLAGMRAFATPAPAATPKPTGPRLDENNEPRFLEQVKLFYNSAAAKTGISTEYLNLIASCQTVVRFNIPLRRDNGSLETITCYR